MVEATHEEILYFVCVCAHACMYVSGTHHSLPLHMYL